MYITIVIEALPGPPPVSTKALSKIWNAPIELMIRHMNAVGVISGNVTCRMVCHRFAPSISAAS